MTLNSTHTPIAHICSTLKVLTSEVPRAYRGGDVIRILRRQRRNDRLVYPLQLGKRCEAARQDHALDDR